MVQAGYEMAFAPKAMTYWGRPNKLSQFWRENFNYGRGDGEALIKVPFAFKLHQKGMPEMLVPLITGLRVMQTQCKFSAFKRAIINLDIAAFFFMPVLAFGNGWNFGKGFLIGHSHGNKHCQACRIRLPKEYGR
jgi:hypothetical protein